MKNYKVKFLIPWEVNDSAEAKIAQQGASILSNVELLQITIGLTKTQAQELWLLCEQDLRELGKLTTVSLMKIKGIGLSKALKIVGIFELMRRRSITVAKERPKIKSSQDAERLLRPLMEDLPYEEFWILLLNRNNQVFDTVKISQGGIAGTVTDVRLILNAAVEKLACNIILAHNHPSGNLNPSEADIKITRKVKEACLLLDISVLDHIIISEQGYLSLADDNLM